MDTDQLASSESRRSGHTLFSTAGIECIQMVDKLVKYRSTMYQILTKAIKIGNRFNSICRQGQHSEK